MVGSPRLREGNRGGSNGIVPVGSPRIWLEPRQWLAFIECLPVEVFPDGRAMVVEDGMEEVGVGWVKNADNPITVVLELIACDTSPIIRLLHGMRFVGLNVGSSRAQEGAVGGGHAALPRE